MIKLIEEKRKEKGLTQVQLSEIIGLSVREYQYIVSGEIKLFKKNTIKILKELGIFDVKVSDM